MYTNSYFKTFLAIDSPNTLSLKNSYPRFNLVEENNKYVLEFALAGFKQNELSVDTEDNLLRISGKSNSSKERTFLHRGIALRDFDISFDLGDKLKVSNVSFVDGMLIIVLEKIIPPGKEKKVWL